MKKIFELVQNLQNLNQIKRTGGNLALGLPTSINVSIAEHSYIVSYLAMLLVDKLNEPTVSLEKVLRSSITHDWSEMIIGDIPSGSPSFGSYWSINIREEAKKAEEKAFSEILNFINDDVSQKKYQIELNDKEKLILKSADITAYLIEMQEWKYLGFNHDGWEMIWFNTLSQLEKIDLPFITDLVIEIKAAYQRGSKRPSPWLAKASNQVNPEHKV